MDDRHHQEESKSRSFFGSIWNLNSTFEEEEEVVQCDDFGAPGNIGHNRFTSQQNLNDATRNRVPKAIECFNDADISAACMLLDMSTNHSSRTVEEYSKQQKTCSFSRVSESSDHGAPAVPPVDKLMDEAVANYSGPSKAASALTADDALGTVQERMAPWATHRIDSAGPPKLELELRTVRGKKRIKPRNDEREMNLFGMNHGVLGQDKCDILDAPTRKRHYKSLRVLLGVK